MKMVGKIGIEQFMEQAKEIPVIDVRSPGEFIQGHIPGAINLPLFDNDERAVVGTIYKNSGRDDAVLKGLEFAGPKMAGFAKKMHQLAPQKEILVHCWRGGMRSEQMAWLFDQCGFKTSVLTGGYKTYRRYIRESFSLKATIIVLGGMTGSSKTEILHQLARMGEQVLDLELLSCHKGSVFGALGQDSQPTNEQFENNIFSEWQKFDPARIIWIEDESRSIGSVIIPDPLFEQMSHAPIILTEMEQSLRIQRLVKEYAGFEKGLLKEAVNKISEKLGGTRTKLALDAINNSDFKTVSELVLWYYDKAYEHAVSKRGNKHIRTTVLTEDDSVKNAKMILNRLAGLIRK
jgi:tRNA 2-selenouridine synthase